MRNIMSQNGTAIKLQKKITDEIDRIIKERPELFYRTRTDFICDAIRKHLQNLSGGNNETISKS